MFSKTSKADAAALTASSTATAAGKKGVPSVISSDLHILGNLVSEGPVDVDGSLEGNLKADQVTIRANGRIKGDIVATVAHIYGQVQGLIRAQSVHLYASCHVEGVVMHQSLSVEDGAFVDGKFKRLQDDNSSHEGSDSEDGGDGIIESMPVAGNGSLRLIG